MTFGVRGECLVSDTYFVNCSNPLCGTENSTGIGYRKMAQSPLVDRGLWHSLTGAFDDKVHKSIGIRNRLMINIISDAH